MNFQKSYAHFTLFIFKRDFFFIYCFKPHPQPKKIKIYGTDSGTRSTPHNLRANGSYSTPPHPPQLYDWLRLIAFKLQGNRIRIRKRDEIII